MIKAIIRQLIILIAIILALIAIALTPFGLKVGVRLATTIFLPGKFYYQHMSGTILGPVKITGIKYKNANTNISVQKLYWNWQLSQLLHRKFVIKDFQVKKVIVNFTAPKHIHKPKKEFKEGEATKKTIAFVKEINNFIQNVQNKRVHLPFQMKNAQIDEVTISSPNLNYHIQSINLQTHIQSNNVNVNINAIGNQTNNEKLQFNLNGNFQHYQLKLNVQYAQHRWELIGNGDNQHIQLHTKKSEIFAGKLAGNLNLYWAPHLKWELKLNANNLNFSTINPQWTNINKATITSNGHESDNKLKFNLLANIVTPSSQINVNATQQQLSGELTFNNLKLHFNVTNKWEAQTWQGIINQLTLNVSTNSVWRLAKPVDVTYDLDHLKFTSLCLYSKTHGQFCANGQWSAQKPWLINVSGKNIPLQPLADEIDQNLKAQGVLNLNAKISGKNNSYRPTIQGSAVLQNGKIYIPYLNLTLRKVKIDLQAAQNVLSFNASTFAGKSKLIIKGSTNLADKNYTTNATINGNNLLIVNNEEATLYASPQLALHMQGYHLLIDGKISINKGEINIENFRDTVELPENEITFIGKPKVDVSSPWQTTLQLQLHIRKVIKINIHNLSGKLSGNLTINSLPKQPILTSGRVFIEDGKYNAYGRMLKITPKSFIEYTKSPIANPSLHVDAKKKIEVLSATGAQNLGQNMITVGLRLRGDIRKPIITLFSNPPTLSQADILSYLILGTPSSSLSSSKLSFLLQAVNALNLGGSEVSKALGVVNEIKQGLGLSELGVETKTPIGLLGIPTEQQTSFVVGKHLTKKIYVRYSIGLGNTSLTDANVLTIRYLLSKHWSVQANNSKFGTGGDILYTINKK